MMGRQFSDRVRVLKPVGRPTMAYRARALTSEKYARKGLSGLIMMEYYISAHHTSMRSLCNLEPGQRGCEANDVQIQTMQAHAESCALRVLKLQQPSLQCATEGDLMQM